MKKKNSQISSFNGANCLCQKTSKRCNCSLADQEEASGYSVRLRNRAPLRSRFFYQHRPGGKKKKKGEKKDFAPLEPVTCSVCDQRDNKLHRLEVAADRARFGPWNWAKPLFGCVDIERMRNKLRKITWYFFYLKIKKIKELNFIFHLLFSI